MAQHRVVIEPTMNFLNAILLGGATASLAPLVIHVLNRARFRQVDWGAMHLLDAAVHSNKRRVHWESLLLLLLRCLIPALLALTLARPVLTQLQSAGSGNVESLGLLLDNSLSMSAADQDGSLLSRASSQIGQIADHSSAKEIRLWTTSTPISPESPQRLDDLPAHGSSSPADALIYGLRQLQAMPTVARQLVFASDFQASQWQSLSDGDLRTIGQQAQSPPFPCDMVLLPVTLAQPAENLSIELVDAQAFANQHAAYRLSAKVHNHSRNDKKDLRIVFRADGSELSSRTISLLAGASEQIDFGCSFEDVGWHTIAVHIEDPGSVRGDDWSILVVQVTPTQRIVIIDSLAESGMFRGASRFLQLALAPFENSSDNPYRIDVVDSAELKPQLLDEADAVIVANISSWEKRTVEMLEQFVDTGGGLLVFAQESFAEDAPNRLTSMPDKLLPMQFGPSRSVAADSAVSLVAPPGNLPALQFLVPNSGIKELHWTRWLDLSPSSASNVTTAADVLLEFDNGLPFLVRQNHDAGVVLQCASTCADEWSNYPSQAAFVPLMLALTDILTHHHEIRTQFQTGESIMIRSPQINPAEMIPIETIPAEKISVGKMPVDKITVELVAPVGNSSGNQRFEVPVVDGRAVFQETNQPGLYRVVSPTLPPNAWQPELFTVGAPAAESVLASVSPGELDRIARLLGAQVSSSADNYVRATRISRDGLEIWRWLLVGVLVLLFVELLLGLRTTRGAA